MQTVNKLTLFPVEKYYYLVPEHIYSDVQFLHAMHPLKNATRLYAT